MAAQASKKMPRSIMIDHRMTPLTIVSMLMPATVTSKDRKIITFLEPILSDSIERGITAIALAVKKLASVASALDGVQPKPRR